MTEEKSKTTFELLFSQIEELIKPLGFSYNKPKDLAKAVLKLSDLFIEENHNQTPWDETWAEAAYLAYYTPLNFWRWTNLLERIASADLFEDLNEILDFGCGSGSASLATSTFLNRTLSFKGYDTAEAALTYYRKLLPGSQVSKDLPKSQLTSKKDRILLASYVLNELEQAPKLLKDCHHMILVEPSTQIASRRLMTLKTSLEQMGFHIWGPCTHANQCPMLEDQGNWCHQRTLPLPPSPLKSLENYLPIKNNTLTYSYLLASKEPIEYPNNFVSMVSDEQKEKGKTRYLTCGSKGLQWISHLKRDKLDLNLKRGDRALIRYDELEQKKTELRIKNSNSVIPSLWSKED